MPLRVSYRVDTGTLWITGTVRPAGARGDGAVRVRRRAGTDDVRLAREEAAALEAAILRDAWHGPAPAQRARTWGDAVHSYLTHAPRSPATCAYLRRLLVHLGDVPLRLVTQEALDQVRGVMFRPGATPATVRRGLYTPALAVLRHAAHPSRRWCDAPALDIPRDGRGRTAYLTPDQVEALLAGARALRPLLVYLVCTGCRVSEALALDWRDVDLPAGRALLWEGETKGGRRRVVLIPPAAVVALAALPQREGRVFPSPRGGAYRDSLLGGGQFRRAWASALARAGLSGWTPHHLRHTWATWHYAIHHDLLRLRSEGGWGTTRMVERYAHIMPVGHEDGILRVWGMARESHVGGGDNPQAPVIVEYY